MQTLNMALKCRLWAIVNGEFVVYTKRAAAVQNTWPIACLSSLNRVIDVGEVHKSICDLQLSLFFCLLSIASHQNTRTLAFLLTNFSFLSFDTNSIIQKNFMKKHEKFHGKYEYFSWKKITLHSCKTIQKFQAFTEYFLLTCLTADYSLRVVCEFVVHLVLQVWRFDTNVDLFTCSKHPSVYYHMLVNVIIECVSRKISFDFHVFGSCSWKNTFPLFQNFHKKSEKIHHEKYFSFFHAKYNAR